MHLETRIFLFVGGLLILGLVINLLRTRRLREEFALLWLAAAILLVLAPLGVDLLDRLAYAVGIEYPPALILTIAIVCLLGILFQFSLRISRFTDQIKVLTQDLALLHRRIEELEAGEHIEEAGEASVAMPGETLRGPLASLGASVQGDTLPKAELLLEEPPATEDGGDGQE